MRIQLALAAMITVLFAPSVFGAVTYATCPTLAPLPITSFTPAAMVPIQNTQRAFDIGMNVTIKNAVTLAATTQLNAINSNFSTLLENSIKLSRSQHEQEMQIEKQFSRIKQAYESHLSQQIKTAYASPFPGDPSVAPPRPGQQNTGVSANSPMVTLARNMCNVAKMNQFANSEQSKDKITKSVNRRNQKITASISAVSNVSMVAKQNMDMHYELFCSAEDHANALCQSVSVAPNADISAFNFLYPSGYRGENPDYQTMYTYSPVESLAAYSYIRHLTGTLYTAPPSESERKDGTRALFAALHKQSTAVLSMAADVMLEIAQLREPLNNTGTRMSAMDILAYQIESNADPKVRRTSTSATESGKMLEVQRQMVINNQLRLLLLKQKDAQRRLQAADIAISSTVESLQSN